MDQHAFRQLISTPRSSSTTEPSSSAPRYFGKQNKRIVKEKKSLNSSDLLPRKVGGSSSKKADGSKTKEKSIITVNSFTGETYVDRAEARRLGKEEINEYSKVEVLRKDFERRIQQEEDEEEREKLENQLKYYLGGDARHSGLVKGLDYTLLAQQKAKLRNGNGSETGNDGMDDEEKLEDAYSSSKGAESEKLKYSGSKAAPSKFKPIGGSTGFKSVDVEEEGAPEYIWRNGKRMRKKKKNKESVVAPDSIDANREASSSLSVPAKKSDEIITAKVNRIDESRNNLKTNQQKKSEQERAEMPPPPIVPSLKAKELALNKMTEREEEEMGSGTDDANNSDDDGADIFADAGRWNGLDEDDDDDDGETISDEKIAVKAIPEVPPSGKRDWFSTDKGVAEENSDKSKESDPLPCDLNNILKTVNEAKKSHEAKENESSDSEEDEVDQGEQQAVESTRLEGFSDSILGREGVRYMLEKKDDEGDHQKRKRKRSKKGKGGYGSD